MIERTELDAAAAAATLTIGDHVFVTDRKSGYSGCTLSFLGTERGWIICRNDTCPKFFHVAPGRPPIGAVRVRSVSFVRKGVAPCGA